MIYITSDMHFGHDREFIWKERGFDSVEEMNETIIERWNKTISDEDEVYILGDLLLGDLEAGIVNLKKLNGKFHIIAGNHDTDSRIERYKAEGWSVVWADRLDYKGYHFLLSHFPTLTSNLDDGRPLKQRTCNLYGHTHQKDNFYQDIPYMYHVGVDSHNCYPVLLDTIIYQMENKFAECTSFLD